MNNNYSIINFIIFIETLEQVAYSGYNIVSDIAVKWKDAILISRYIINNYNYISNLHKIRIFIYITKLKITCKYIFLFFSLTIFTKINKRYIMNSSTILC